MSYETLTVVVSERIATITVNRPEKLNALSAQVIGDLGLAIDAVRERPDADGVILTGAGRAFVAGGDITELEQNGPVAAEQRSRRGQEVFRRFETCPKPTIAAVNGFALGGQGRALGMLLTGELIDAAEALRIGLVNRVVPADQLMSVATAMLRTMLDNAPLALAQCIETVNAGYERRAPNFTGS